MGDLLLIDGPIPAWYRITSTTHGLECEQCRTGARHAAAFARTYGAGEYAVEFTDGYDIDHGAAVTRLAPEPTPTGEE